MRRTISRDSRAFSMASAAFSANWEMNSLVLHGEGNHLARIVLGVDELQDADDLVVPRLQGHAEDGARAIVGLLVEGGIEGEGDVALDMVHVVDEDRFSRLGHVTGEGALVDGDGGAAGDVLVLRLPAEERVVLHES